MADTYKIQLRVLALISFVLAIIATGIGGYADIMNKPITITKTHAWNDGLFLMLASLVLLLASFF